MFEDLPLHDATLDAIHVDWRMGSCTLSIETSRGSSELVFAGLLNIVVPRDRPWGPSVSINEVRERDGGFEIEMQTGDVIRVIAKSWHFVDDAEASNPSFQRTASPPLN